MQLFFTMGLPVVITTDQGKEFHNQFDKQMMQAFGVTYRMTTPYHPQANGFNDRHKQTLVNAVAKCSQEYCCNWDKRLGEVVYMHTTQ